MPTKDCGLCDLVINCGASVGDRDQFQTGTVRLLCELVDNLRSFPFTDLVWAGFAQLTTPAANDWLLISDTSAGGVSKKITYADLFDSPPDNAIYLGTATSNRYKALYLTDGTVETRLFPDGANGARLLNYTDHVLMLGTNNLRKLVIGNSADSYAIYPYTATQSLGKAGTTNGFTSAYFTNGTATGAIKYSGNTLQFGSTSAHDIQLLASTANVGLTAGKQFYPGGTGYTLGANSTSTAWQVAYFTNGTVKGFLSAGTAGLGVGTLTNHNLRWAVDIEGTEEAITLNTSGHFYPAAATQTLGLTGTTNGWNAAYFTNGTATGAIKYSTTDLRIGATSDHAVKIIQGDVARIVLNTDGRPIFYALNSAVVDGGLIASQLSIYLDESGHNLVIKAKYADGTTVKTYTIAAD